MKRNEVKILQEWYGWIEMIGEFYISAHLKDITNGGTDEEVVFTWFDIKDEDQDEIRPGSVFKWTIGIKGTTTFSDIVFEPAKELSKEDLINASKRAEKFYKIFK